MSYINHMGLPVKTKDALPKVGSRALDFTLTGLDMQDYCLADFEGYHLVLNIFPSIDTNVCSESARVFDAILKEHPSDQVKVLCISADLPFAQARFCVNENTDLIIPLSTFRSHEFSADYGVEMVNGKFKGLCARAVIVITPTQEISHVQLVEELEKEPDYHAVMDSIRL